MKMQMWFVFYLRFLLVLLFLCSSAEAAIQSLEIIAPRAGLNTSNRYYKAYPGLEFSVPIAAIGGRYPNTYSLTSGPSGMSVDASSGILVWPNPVTSGSPHSVTVQVTDALGATAYSKVLANGAFEVPESSAAWNVAGVSASVVIPITDTAAVIVSNAAFFKG